MCCEKALTYEEAKQLCMKAFDGGATYGSESVRYGVNARAYDWEHWLAKNERLFKPRPTVEDVLLDACKAYHSLMVESMSDVAHDMPAPSEVIAKYAKRLTLAEGEDA